MEEKKKIKSYNDLEVYQRAYKARSVVTIVKIGTSLNCRRICKRTSAGRVSKVFR